MFDVYGVHLEKQQSSTQSKADGVAFGCGLSLSPPKKRERPPTGIGRKEGDSTSHPFTISVPVPREGFALAFSEGGCDDLLWWRLGSQQTLCGRLAGSDMGALRVIKTPCGQAACAQPLPQNWAGPSQVVLSPRNYFFRVRRLIVMGSISHPTWRSRI